MVAAQAPARGAAATARFAFEQRIPESTQQRRGPFFARLTENVLKLPKEIFRARLGTIGKDVRDLLLPQAKRFFIQQTLRFATSGVPLAIRLCC